MRTRLRNKKKKRRKGLGGRAKLTGKLIDELSIYNCLAIRRNSDCIAKMRKEMFATLFYKIFTDENSLRENCLVCEDSWCSWQLARARGDLISYKHRPAMDSAVYDAILPI